jgi:hypothetical protein
VSRVSLKKILRKEPSMASKQDLKLLQTLTWLEEISGILGTMS